MGLLAVCCTKPWRSLDWYQRIVSELKKSIASFTFTAMCGAMGTVCPPGALAATSTSTKLSSSGRSCYRKFSRIPGLYPAPYSHSRSPNFKPLASGSCSLLPTPCTFLGRSCRRTALSLPSLIPIPVLRKSVAHELRAVNEPYVTQSISNERNEGESEVVPEGSRADDVQLNEEGSPSEVGVLLSTEYLAF